MNLKFLNIYKNKNLFDYKFFVQKKIKQKLKFIKLFFYIYFSK